MRTTLRIAAIVTILLLGSGALMQLQAGGIGVYSGVTAGMQDLKLGSASVAASGSNTAFALGFGIVYDTAAAKDKLFNYRLNIGYANMFYKDVNPFDKGTYHMVTWSNTFGIGFFRRSMVRLWAGPLLGISYQVNTVSSKQTIPLGPLSFTIDQSYQIHHVNFNVGALLGVNVNPGGHFTFSFECGIQGGGGVGTALGEVTVGSTLLSFLKLNLAGNSKTSSTNVEFISRLSFMYRLGDTFAAPSKKTLPAPQPPDEKKTTPVVPTEPEKKTEAEKKPVPEVKPAPAPAPVKEQERVPEPKPAPVKEEKTTPRPADPPSEKKPAQ